MNLPLLPFQNEFWILGCSVLKHDPDKLSARTIGLKRFKSTFGISPRGCAAIWSHIIPCLLDGCKEIHLLYALVFMRHYMVESLNRIVFDGVDEKPFRKWCFRMIDHLHLGMTDVIDFEKRRDGAPEGAALFVSLDATDCPINEPHTADGGIDPAYYSHKLKGAGLKYEIGLCIRSGDIVWVNGGVPCGSYNDVTLARSSFVLVLDEHERAAADDGYPDPHFVYPQQFPQYSGLLKEISQRHETLNNLFKRWRVLSTPFRHPDETLHLRCFYAIANITQKMFDIGESCLFSVIMGNDDDDI